MEKLLNAGALDVFFTPIYMKKNRPAVKLSFLSKANNVKKLEKIVFAETSTIGIRKIRVERTIMDRNYEIINTRYGKIQEKKVSYEDVSKSYYEYEDIKKAAIKHDIPIQLVYDEVKKSERQL